MPLSSTQIGAIGENILINEVMKASNGRLSPFQPMADDDGLDVLFFDKKTGSSIAIQLKCRTKSVKNGNTIHFQVRQATFREDRHTYLVAAFLDEKLTHFMATWFISMELLPTVSKDNSGKWVIRPSKSKDSADRYTSYRCMTCEELVNRIIAECEKRAK